MDFFSFFCITSRLYSASAMILLLKLVRNPVVFFVEADCVFELESLSLRGWAITGLYRCYG